MKQYLSTIYSKVYLFIYSATECSLGSTAVVVSLTHEKQAHWTWVKGGGMFLGCTYHGNTCPENLGNRTTSFHIIFILSIFVAHCCTILNFTIERQIKKRHRKTPPFLTRGTDVLTWKHFLQTPDTKPKRGSCDKITIFISETVGFCLLRHVQPLITNMKSKGISMQVLWEHTPVLSTDNFCISKHICTCPEAVQTYTTSKYLTLSAAQHSRVCQLFLNCCTKKDLTRASPSHTC